MKYFILVVLLASYVAFAEGLVLLERGLLTDDYLAAFNSLFWTTVLARNIAHLGRMYES